MLIGLFRHQEQRVPQTARTREALPPTRRHVTCRATRALPLPWRVRPDTLPMMPTSCTARSRPSAHTTCLRQRRACTRAQTMRFAAEHRVSTKLWLGTLPDIVFHLPDQREAAGAAISARRRFVANGWCQPVEHPGGAPAQVGALQRQRRPPTAAPTADRLGRQPASAPGGDGTEGSDGGRV